MLLGRRAVFAFNDHVGFGKAGTNIAMADLIMTEDVRLLIREEQRRAWFACLIRIGNHR